MENNLLKQYKKVLTITRDIPGWLSEQGCLLLYEKARKLSGRGVIVEIGSWKGRSTTCLALGSKKGMGIPVYAVDPHTGSPEHRVKNRSVNTYSEFIKNITQAKVTQLVKPIKLTSRKAAKLFNKKVELLFIDGAHDYKSVKNDFELWVPKVVAGGWVLIHDSLEPTWPGPKRIADESILKSKKFKNVGFVGVITFGQKTNKATLFDTTYSYYILLLKTIIGSISTIHFPDFIYTYGRLVLNNLQKNSEQE